jgi:hypothetical protein
MYPKSFQNLKKYMHIETSGQPTRQNSSFHREKKDPEKKVAQFQQRRNYGITVSVSIKLLILWLLQHTMQLR